MADEQQKDFRYQAELFSGDEGKSETFSQPQFQPPNVWDPLITRRMRVLLHASPLLWLKRAEPYLDEDCQHYDLLTLSMKVLDMVIDNMGLETEIDSDTVRRGLTPLLNSMDIAAGHLPDSTRHERVASKVLAALRNDAENRRPFSQDYTDFDTQGEVVQRRIEFRLVEDHFHATGRTVLRLSNEAVNLYLSALEMDIEDAQAATEAVVHSQLARGKFNEAIQSARNANWHSMRYEQKIGRIVQETRRDIGRVDWREEVPRLLDEAMAHITTRLSIEDSIIETADERLHLLPPDDNEGAVVLEIISLIRRCRTRHLTVQRQLMGAREVFLEEQARQAFAPRTARPLLHLASQVLESLMQVNKKSAAQATEEVFPGFVGASAPGTFLLRDLLLWQLQPRRQVMRVDAIAEESDLAEYGVDPLRYPPDLYELAAFELDVNEPTLFSRLLEKLTAKELSHTQPDGHILELIGQHVLLHYAPDETLYRGNGAENEATLRLIVRNIEDKSFRVGAFFGDELIIERSLENDTS